MAGPYPSDLTLGELYDLVLEGEGEAVALGRRGEADLAVEILGFMDRYAAGWPQRALARRAEQAARAIRGALGLVPEAAHAL